jgi:hypothetical protein
MPLGEPKEWAEILPAGVRRDREKGPASGKHPIDS